MAFQLALVKWTADMGTVVIYCKYGSSYVGEAEQTSKGLDPQ
jgi:hypothetical protein